MRAFQISFSDNTATALEPVTPGEVKLLGDAVEAAVEAKEVIPAGHKIALRDIAAGEKIVKYGVVIGRASADIERGSWVHLHNIHSCYDERSSHLDAVTGTPKDTRYE